MWLLRRRYLWSDGTNIRFYDVMPKSFFVAQMLYINFVIFFVKGDILLLLHMATLVATKEISLTHTLIFQL